MTRSNRKRSIPDREASTGTKRGSLHSPANPKLLLACGFFLLLTPIPHAQAIQESPQKSESEGTSNVLARGRLNPIRKLQVRNNTTMQLTVSEVIPSRTSVKPGDQIVRFDSSEIEKQINSARIEIANIKAETLAAETKISSTEMELKAAQINIESRLELLKLKSESLFSNTGRFSFEVAELERTKSLQEKRVNLLKKKLEVARKTGEKEALTILELELELLGAENLIASATQNMNRIKKHDIPIRKKELEATISELKLQLTSTQSSFHLELETRKAALQATRLALQQKERSLNRLGEELKLCVIRAEIEGVVTYNSNSLKPGAVFRPNQELLLVYDPTELHATVLVFPADLERIKQGQQASVDVSPNGDGAKSFVVKGEVTEIATQPSAYRGPDRGESYEVTIKIDKKLDDYLAFSPVKVEIKVE